MSVTRLLVLGTVRIFGPAHGYLVRRELDSWQVAEWAHLNPGSIYHALRALAKDGLLVEEPDSQASGRVSRQRTVYRLTVDGEREFERLVRTALWELHPYEQGWIHAGIAFWWVLSRGEVIDALTARLDLLDARITSDRYVTESISAPDSGKPAHVVESFRFQEALLGAERSWVAQTLERVRAGAYSFAGDEPGARAVTGHRVAPTGTGEPSEPGEARR